MLTIDICVLDGVTGGAGKQATYLNTCARGAGDGALAGATSGAGMLPFAAMSGPLTPATVGTFIGVGAASGAVLGCGQGMWELYKARHPLEQ
jgi:hypothetical protein